MTRRARWLIPSSVLLAASAVCISAGCNDTGAPPLQTVPQAKPGQDADDIVQTPTADEKKVAMERLDKAIKAHGGPEQMRKLTTHVEILKGQIITARWGLVQADQELRLDLTDRLRLRVTASTPDGKQDIVIAIDKGKAWMSNAGIVHNIPGDVYNSVIEELHYRRIMMLLPLKEPEFIVRPIDGEKVNGKPTSGIRVGSKDHRSINLYFDDESGLLVRTLHPAWLEGDKVQRRDVLLLEHKPFGGLKLPSAIIDKRDGSIWLDCKADYRFEKQFDPKDFAQP